MTEIPESQEVGSRPTRAEAKEYKESLGVVRTREEAERLVQQENQK